MMLLRFQPRSGDRMQPRLKAVVLDFARYEPRSDCV